MSSSWQSGTSCVSGTRIKKIQRIKSGKDGLLTPLLGQDGTRFVLSIRVVGELWRAGGHRALQDGLLQVVKHGRVLFSEERHGHAALTSSTSTTNTMDVVCRRKCLLTFCVFWKIKNTDKKKEVSYLQCSLPCRSWWPWRRPGCQYLDQQRLWPPRCLWLQPWGWRVQTLSALGLCHRAACTRCTEKRRWWALTWLFKSDSASSERRGQRPNKMSSKEDLEDPWRMLQCFLLQDD